MHNICPRCTERLASWGAPCIDITEIACSNYILGNRVLLKLIEGTDDYTWIDQTIEFLEKKGILVTTELPDMQDTISVIPNTRIAFFLPESEIFCWCHWIPGSDACCTQPNFLE